MYKIFGIWIFIVLLNGGVIGQNLKLRVIASGGNVIQNNEHNAGITIGQAAIGINYSYDSRANIGFWYSGLELITSIEELGMNDGDVLSISQNYPNPFMYNTYFEMDIPDRAHVNLRIFDINGNLVDVLINEILMPGKYKISWLAPVLPSGSYEGIITINNDEFHIIKGITKILY